MLHGVTFVSGWDLSLSLQTALLSQPAVEVFTWFLQQCSVLVQGRQFFLLAEAVLGPSGSFLSWLTGSLMLLMVVKLLYPFLISVDFGLERQCYPLHFSISQRLQMLAEGAGHELIWAASYRLLHLSFSTC